MKRSTFTAVLAFVLGVSTVTQANACLCIPYIPFLDPFAWLGFYGCGGYGYGGGCGYGAPSYGAPAYGYGYGGYAPVARPMAYPIAPVASGCAGALPVQQQQAMTAVQVPVTTYRAVTQYVPQTTYQTQYRPAPAPSVAYQPQISNYQQAYGYGYQQAYTHPQPQTAYAAPTYGGAVNPTAEYEATIAAPSNGAVYGTPYYSAPTIQPPAIANPSGDIHGDHEWPAQSANIPVYPNAYSGRTPVRAASYGVTPRAARSFSATVR